jgi:ABC-2 type transport system permease protein
MVIDGFRYGMIGQADGSLLFGGSILLALNITLAIVCFYILKSGYRLKS